MVCPRCQESRVAFLAANGFCKNCNKDMFDKTASVPQTQTTPTNTYSSLPQQAQPLTPEQQQVYAPKKVLAAEMVNKVSVTANVSIMAMIFGFILAAASIISRYGSIAVCIVGCFIFGWYFIKSKRYISELSNKYNLTTNQFQPLNK